jgi:membrane protease subunit HflC
MKQSTLSLLVGFLLVIIFGLLLFAYQVRQTEVAVVTTFGKPTSDRTEPGLYWKMPWPIQKVYQFDKRIQNFEEDKFEETFTSDKKNLLVRVYADGGLSNREFSSSASPMVRCRRPSARSKD